jgi:hypothetical protein
VVIIFIGSSLGLLYLIRWVSNRSSFSASLSYTDMVFSIPSHSLRYLSYHVLQLYYDSNHAI